jgi:hypothetical protein
LAEQKLVKDRNASAVVVIPLSTFIAVSARGFSPRRSGVIGVVTLKGAAGDDEGAMWPFQNLPKFY